MCTYEHTCDSVYSPVHMYLCLYMRVHVYEMHMFFLSHTGMTCVYVTVFKHGGTHVFKLLSVPMCVQRNACVCERVYKF